MPIAIRHKKSRPAWLALIAMAAAGVTIVVTLATVVISSVVQTRRASDQPAAAALTGRPEGRTGVRVTVPAPSQESPDALAAQAEAGSKAAAQAEAGSMASAAGAGSTRAAAAASASLPVTPVSDTAGLQPAQHMGSRVEKTTAAGVTDPAATATATATAAATAVAVAVDADAHLPTPKHRYLPSRASTHPGSRRAGGSAAANAARARGEGSLRADITRYNAERGSATERRRPLTLRAASVPSVRSLWDEVPRPLSELYRN
ncbi:MAG: hypothetical protein ACRYHA_02320 [Janthinobacterium lividum]